jgi:hypothetical protein
MHNVRFRAVVTLDPADAHPGTALHPVPRQFPNHTHALMLRPTGPRESGESGLFPAEICMDDQDWLRCGEHAVVTITVNHDLAATFFRAGQHFTLWAGGDVGHGVISRRVFTDGGPC